MQPTTNSRKPDWEEGLAAAAKNGSIQELLARIQNELAGLAGTPRQALQHNAVQYIEAALDYDSAELVLLAEALSATEQELGEELAVFILSVHYGGDPDRAAALLQRLAASGHAPVREWAAKACGAVLAKHFALFYPMLETWTRNESPFVRRAVIAAVQLASNAKNPAWGPLLLDMLEPLMRDNDPVVRKELAPRTWSGLLRYYTEDVEARLMKWAVSEDRFIRRHAARLFSAPEAALHVQRLSPALRILLRDESASVQKAAVSSLLQVSKRIHKKEAAELLGAVQ
ncbi:DNA alkylation repair protein [Paenibacillus allorhizosphaerae]|uniref:HEAT repeat domain-containing protein n=1 Tax=Paenibacillus allorhizosphaerae TaxID=2849866 RepID=A0ABM8VFB2_9BACL|nr:DNA alkylation repair protein [Paenibacillus allorhizosphaerae]CAG7634508.1 hypothetical protein PAECIP111802_02035 [Paenibacillus allorhizosphaerae]